MFFIISFFNDLKVFANALSPLLFRLKFEKIFFWDNSFFRLRLKLLFTITLKLFIFDFEFDLSFLFLVFITSTPSLNKLFSFELFILF